MTTATAAPANTESAEAFVGYLKDCLHDAAGGADRSLVVYLNGCLPGLGDRWRQTEKLKNGISAATFKNILRWALAGRIDDTRIQRLELEFPTYLKLVSGRDGRRSRLKGDLETANKTSQARMDKLVATSRLDASDFADPGAFVHWSTNLLFNLSRENKNRQSINSAKAILQDITDPKTSRFFFKDDKQRHAALCCFLSSACLIAVESNDLSNASIFFDHLLKSSREVRDPTSRALASICAAAIVRNFKLPFDEAAPAQDNWWRLYSFEAYTAANSDDHSIFSVQGLASLAAVEVGRDRRFVKEGLHQFTGSGERLDYVDMLLAQIEDEEGVLSNVSVARHAALCITLSHGFIASKYSVKHSHAITLLSLAKSRMIQCGYLKHLAWIDWYSCCAAAMMSLGRTTAQAIALQRAQELAGELNSTVTSRSYQAMLRSLLMSGAGERPASIQSSALDDILSFLAAPPPSL